MRQWHAALFLGLLLPVCSPAQQLTAGGMQLTLRAGVITALSGRGLTYAQSADPRGLCALRTLKGDVTPPAPSTPAAAGLPLAQDLIKSTGPGTPALRMQVSHDPVSSELVVEQSGEAASGLHGIQWGIAGIPLDYEIIVPGQSGLKLDRNSPLSRLDFRYPMSWECQFVIVQGKTGGFWVWADDPAGQFKTLRLWKRAEGWDLAFESQNLAPFADKTSIRSVKWRLGLIGPKWQEAATKYRQWATRTYAPTLVAKQQPAWVKDTRAMVICSLLQPELMDDLAKTMDPRQTVLYLPDWRRDGYDRNYPDYTALPGLASFLDKAHALGFRVMLHVNYFGCDPKNEAYERLKQYHVREPFSHEPLWWVWPFKGEPDIKFAYINPAAKAWRELFVSRMKELCTKYPVDALHLDQTLCIWNDDAGRVDGLTMVEGTIAEHRELREALPQVALSGEGLNEVTCRYEAFAQRHVFGYNHAEGTWNRELLALAHPVSSSILRPFTIINGYLGMVNSDQGQAYAAWQAAYVNWGVIPTFARPQASQLRDPQGFTRQLLDEIHFYQQERLDPDIEGELFSGTGTLFAYRTRDGKAVAAVRDNGWRLMTEEEGRTVSRTVTGTEELRGPGSIPGWLGYDDKRIFGLASQAWYPWVRQPGDLSAFHVARLPEGLLLTRATCSEELATVVTRDPQETLSIAESLGSGRCGYTVFDGEGEAVAGPLNDSKGGASFTAQGHDLHVHPPWKATRKNPQTGVTEAVGTGQVYCLLRVEVPPESHARFVSEVYMDPGAVGAGKTDGVTFSIEAGEGAAQQRAELNMAQSEPQPLELDLSAFAGQDVLLKLTVDPGPQHSATYDWARWRNPRVVLSRKLTGAATIISPTPWALALTATGEAAPREIAPHTYEVTATFPGAIFLLNRPLTEVTLPCDLTKLSFVRSCVSPEGALLQSPQYAVALVGDNTVDGVSRHGFFVHPPMTGQTRMDFPLRLPATAQRLTCAVGLRQGSKSEGCIFSVEVSGQEVARRRMLPGKWEDLSADLKPFAGKAVLLSLVTDAETTFNFDWGCWGEPRVE